MKQLHKAWLLIGGNEGNREENLSLARTAIESRAGHILAQSAVYETAAWGKEDQSSFLNQALAIATALSPEELLSTLLGIEWELGRVREVRYGPRTIDIDILLYDEEIVNQPHLRIPHPELPGRRFALHCLHDIAPDYIHPQLHLTIAELLANCRDPLMVKNFY